MSREEIVDFYKTNGNVAWNKALVPFFTEAFKIAKAEGVRNLTGAGCGSCRRRVWQHFTGQKR